MIIKTTQEDLKEATKKLCLIALGFGVTIGLIAGATLTILSLILISI